MIKILLTLTSYTVLLKLLEILKSSILKSSMLKKRVLRTALWFSFFVPWPDLFSDPWHTRACHSWPEEMASRYKWNSYGKQCLRSYGTHDRLFRRRVRMAKLQENGMRRRHASFADSEYQIEKRRTYYTRPDTPFRYSNSGAFAAQRTTRWYANCGLRIRELVNSRTCQLAKVVAGCCKLKTSSGSLAWRAYKAEEAGGKMRICGPADLRILNV